MTQDDFDNLVHKIFDNRFPFNREAAIEEMLGWSHAKEHSADHLFRLVTHVDGFADTERREWDYLLEMNN